GSRRGREAPCRRVRGVRVPAITATRRMLVIRRIASLLLPAVAVLSVLVTTSSADLNSRYQASQQRSSQLRTTVRSETNQIAGFEGTIGTLQARLDAVAHSGAIEEGLLNTVDDQLASARTRLAQLRVEYAHDLAVLGNELRAEYESPPPTIVGVVVDAGGFDQLLNGISYLTAIERRNTQTAERVRAARAAVHAETVRLVAVQARRRRATAAVLVERDNVAQLKATIVSRELGVARARARDRGRLKVLHRKLVHEAEILDQRAAQAQTLSSGGAVAPAGGCVNSPFVPHGGGWGFFPASGTNYMINQEPI